MIILDTNIISEMMKTKPAPAVIYWLDQQEGADLFITTITMAEIAYGLNVLPAGNRRNLLDNAFTATIMSAFQQRILVFDESAAYYYGKIMGYRKELGRPLSIADGQIAAIARAQGAAIATRNVSDFEHCEIEIINPFEK